MKAYARRKIHILLLSALIVAAATGLCLLARGGIGIPCLFYSFTGLQCPGCGNSRAVLALLRLDLRSAFSYNLLFPLEFGYLLWVYGVCCHRYLKGNTFSYHPPLPVLDAVFLIILIAWGILRNVM